MMRKMLGIEDSPPSYINNEQSCDTEQCLVTLDCFFTISEHVVQYFLLWFI
jgi:hypothetical protein